MKKYMITIDGGTTNTRCILWGPGRKKLGGQSVNAGARDTAINSGNSVLKERIKTCLEELLEEAGIGWTQIEAVMASGMLTSEVGLAAIPHLEAPAGLQELAAGVAAVKVPEVCPVPISFIPGVRNPVACMDLINHETADVMRGEETECLPIIETYSQQAPLLLILPGSHNKFIAVDENKRITGCVTSISGELLAAVTNNTILAKSVGRSFLAPEAYDPEWVLSGYRNAKRTGLGRACFSARILSLYKDSRPEKIQNYLLGAVLEEDVRALLNTRAIDNISGRTPVICGKDPIKQALIDILREEEILGGLCVFEPESGVPVSALGAYMVAERRKQDVEKPEGP